MQCGTCNHWVHAKCEDLTGEVRSHRQNSQTPNFLSRISKKSSKSLQSLFGCFHINKCENHVMSPDMGATVAQQQVTARVYRKHCSSPLEAGKKWLENSSPGLFFLGMHFIYPCVKYFQMSCTRSCPACPRA